MVLLIVGICLAIIFWKGVLPSIVVTYTLKRKEGRTERSPIMEAVARTFLHIDLEEFECKEKKERENHESKGPEL